MLSNLSVPKKLLAAFAAMIAICGVASGVVALDLRSLQQATRLTDESMALTMASSRLQAAALEQQNAIHGYVASGEDDYVRRFETAEARFQADIAELQKADAQGDYAEAARKLADAKALFEQEAQMLIDMSATPEGRAAAGAQVSSKAQLTSIRQVLQEIEAQEAKEEALRSASRQRAFVRTYMGIFVGGVLALLASLALSATLNKALGRPVTALTGVMTRLAAGDNTVTVPDTARRDEIGAMAKAVLTFKDAAIEKLRVEAQMADARAQAEATRQATEAERAAAQAEQQAVMEIIAGGLTRLAQGDLTHRVDQRFPPAYARLRDDFNAAIGQMEDAMRTIVQAAGGIGAGSDEIATAADDLSRRSERQAASLEETAAALDQITATVRRSSAGAAEAAKVVASARAEAHHTTDVVQNAVTAMNQIEKSSQEISQIVGVIDEIAFQTNLLALNAGVEAARAGDTGLGFAVVAQEVRALAQRSADAAREIKALISSSTRQVGDGVAMVGQTGQALQAIVAKVGEIDGLVGEIAASASEQSAGLNQVNDAINQMDQTVQQNAAMVEESTAASHSLKVEVGGLVEMIGRFQVSGTEMRASGRRVRAA